MMHIYKYYENSKRIGYNIWILIINLKLELNVFQKKIKFLWNYPIKIFDKIKKNLPFIKFLKILYIKINLKKI